MAFTKFFAVATRAAVEQHREKRMANDRYTQIVFDAVLVLPLR